MTGSREITAGPSPSYTSPGADHFTAAPSPLQGPQRAWPDSAGLRAPWRAASGGRLIRYLESRPCDRICRRQTPPATAACQGRLARLPRTDQPGSRLQPICRDTCARLGASPDRVCRKKRGPGQRIHASFSLSRLETGTQPGPYQYRDRIGARAPACADTSGKRGKKGPGRGAWEFRSYSQPAAFAIFSACGRKQSGRFFTIKEPRKPVPGKLHMPHPRRFQPEKHPVWPVWTGHS